MMAAPAFQFSDGTGTITIPDPTPDGVDPRDTGGERWHSAEAVVEVAEYAIGGRVWGQWRSWPLVWSVLEAADLAALQPFWAARNFRLLPLGVAGGVIVPVRWKDRAFRPVRMSEGGPYWTLSALLVERPGALTGPINAQYEGGIVDGIAGAQTEDGTYEGGLVDGPDLGTTPDGTHEGIAIEEF